jgi:hypothetical protein
VAAINQSINQSSATHNNTQQQQQQQQQQQANGQIQVRLALTDIDR